MTGLSGSKGYSALGMWYVLFRRGLRVVVLFLSIVERSHVRDSNSI